MRRSDRAAVGLILGLATTISLAPARGAAQGGYAVGQAVGQSPPPVPIAPAYGRGITALGELVAGLGTTTRVLLIAAHPDDEDNRLLAWLARGQHVETAYLSLTRGDGGQNLIGNELGEALGAIRTEELLAARRVDGGHQYFSRAYDFGFSKSAAEAYTHWPHDSLLGDVVTVVRAFRPHIIIAIFSGTPRDGHGQHQVSGLLAREAYDVSGDTARFPAATYGKPWVASKFYRDRSYFGGGENAMAIDVGAYDPLLGATYAEIAAVSRSQHKSQGEGTIAPGSATGSVYREATRVNASVPAGHERSMFDGIDTTWHRLVPSLHDAARLAELDSIRVLVTRMRTRSGVETPGQLIGPLAQLHALVSGLLGSSVSLRSEASDVGGSGTGRSRIGSAPLDAGSGGTEDMEATVLTGLGRIERASQLAAGVEFHVTVAHDVAPIDAAGVRVAVTAINHGAVPLHVDDLYLEGAANSGATKPPSAGWTIAPNGAWRDTVVARASVATEPWWLTTPRTGDLFSTPVSRIADDVRAGSATISLSMSTGPRTAVPGSVHTEASAVQRIDDPTRGEVDRPLAFVPAISVTLERTVEYVPAGAPINRPVRVLLRSGADSASEVAVSLELPRGLTADTTTRRVTVPAYGTRPVDFRITGALPAGDAVLRATAESHGHTFRAGYIPIEYDHIRPQKLYRPAELRLSVADVRIPPGLTVAYIAGVGDNVAPALEQLGLPVTVLDPASLPSTDLSRFTTIVVGPRAYEASPELRANNGRLLDFARTGGTLVVQYGQYEMTEPGMMPYPITLNRPHDRVTDENAAVRVLDAASPLLAAPNRIGGSDFAGWVQERSLYMPHTFDSHYHAVLSTNDPGEPPNDGAILIAPVGKGTYVYTSLAFFRQLPAGVPGAARLFVNLLAAGRRCCDAM